MRESDRLGERGEPPRRRPYSLQGWSTRGIRDPNRVPHIWRDGDDWLVVSRRRRKAQGQDCSGWDDQQGNWQLEERDDYGNRQSRFRVSTDWYDDD